MDMRSVVPDWLTPVAWTYITLCLLSVAAITTDIYLARRRHHSIASELVWISSALYLGPLAVWTYLRWGRAGNASSPSRRSIEGATGQTAVAVLPGGGASAVAHLVAVPFVVAVGWTIGGLAMWPMILLIALLVVVMLTTYERTASRVDARTLSLGAALVTAAVTVVAFDVGMVGWMLLLHFNNAMPAVTESTFWFLMQLGVIAGLLTGYPAVAWLLRRNRTVVPT